MVELSLYNRPAKVCIQIFKFLKNHINCPEINYARKNNFIHIDNNLLQIKLIQIEIDIL